MTLYKGKYRTTSSRWQNWDYANEGAYFITICTKNRCHYFGDIKNSKMVYSPLGAIANVLWHDIKNHAKNVELGEFVIMPNHIHGILMLTGNNINDGNNHNSATMNANNVEPDLVKSDVALNINRADIDETDAVKSDLALDMAMVTADIDETDVVKSDLALDRTMVMVTEMADIDETDMAKSDLALDMAIVMADNDETDAVKSDVALDMTIVMEMVTATVTVTVEARHALPLPQKPIPQIPQIPPRQSRQSNQSPQLPQSNHPPTEPNPLYPPQNHPNEMDIPNETQKTIGQQRFQNQGKNTISSIVGGFKSALTKHAHRMEFEFAWQSRFHDHVIRNNKSYEKISHYILTNPQNWDLDKFNKNES
jgi:REP element-mobilizing transposase RayT